MKSFANGSVRLVTWKASSSPCARRYLGAYFSVGPQWSRPEA
jgi:hypothetical protein